MQELYGSTAKQIIKDQMAAAPASSEYTLIKFPPTH
jgi:hypothetical protein